MSFLIRRTLLSLALFSLLATPSSLWAEPPAKETAKLPRVLLIGDSISMGYTKPVIDLLEEKARVERVPSNAGNTGKSIPDLPKWLETDGDDWAVIHFNWGLWDLCYRHPESKTQGRRDKIRGKVTHTPEEYRKNLETLVAMLEKTNAKLIWASTTPVPEDEAGRKVGDDLIYNKIAAEVMEAHNIPINDLHALMAPHMTTLTTSKGNVHFKPEGSKMLAKQVAAAIEKALAE
ncbi:SGNH/GDSL hydrolase family protein [Lignipirellula cremea]|uniref:SGNH hydrolase-type esterase domain-containing protein n=1 Tax=Lignipirellula cremea TaxID=2528010 RepID=A0A518DV90_9BACT|nr:SGNH/GDSL hydrolase family protein [Lignipirellula cremea]QDU95748.1 hypothetical protein Pla8534_35650 [Lignipirellula cremea]